MPGPNLDAGVNKPQDAPKPAEKAPKTTEERIADEMMRANGIDPEKADPEERKALIAIVKLMDPKDPDRSLKQNVGQVADLILGKLKSLGFEMKAMGKDKLDQINSVLRGGKMPTEKYSTVLGYYGVGVIDEVVNGQKTGKLVYRKYPHHKAVDTMENRTRVAGDRGVTDLAAATIPELRPLRTKVDFDVIAQNIKELGLEAYFTPVVENGHVTSIKEDPTDVRTGAMLHDLLRDRSGSTFLQGLDLKQALEVSAKMLDQVHKKRVPPGGIGEINGSNIVIQVKDGKITGARLTLPNMKYANEVAPVDQKAIDILDFCFSVAFSGMETPYKKGGSTAAAEATKQAVDNVETVVKNYSDSQVKKAMIAILDQGRPAMSMHNSVRLGYSVLPNQEAVYKEVQGIIKAALVKLP